MTFGIISIGALMKPNGARRIIHVSEATGWSGGAVRLTEVALGLKEKGWRQWVGCRNTSELVGPARKAGMEHFPLALRQDYDLVSAWRLARFVSTHRIDIMHAHHPRAHAVCLMAKLFTRLIRPGGRSPVLVVSRRVSFGLAVNPFSRFKYTSGMIDAYFSVADSVKEQLVAAGVAAERVHVVRSGVDTKRFKPRPPDESLRRELGIPMGRKIVGKVANFSSWKGQEIFLKAARILVDEGLAVHFLLAGRETDGGEAKALIHGLGLEGRVSAVGFREDVPELLSILDVSVNAAVKGEGLSGVLRESLAMDIPVIAADIAGNKELVRDGETGYLCVAGDPAALAAKISLCLNEPVQARGLAIAGGRLVRARFSLEGSIKETDERYNALLRRRADARAYDNRR